MNLFNKVKQYMPPQSKFDLTHERKMAFKMGELTPFLCTEVLPGDNFRINTEAMMRFAPMLAPIMHRVNCYMHFFFVPNRLIWSEWADFITGGEDGAAAPVMPYFNLGTELATEIFPIGSLADYFGLPTIPAGSPADPYPRICALPFRAYQTIYDEYYRDQNLTPKVNPSKASGGISITGAEATRLLTMRKRAWEKDIFTSALPFAQRGNAVLMPVEGDGTITYRDQTRIYRSDTGLPAPTGALTATTAGPYTGLDSNSVDAKIDNIESVEFNNAQVTINDLRNATTLQQFLELLARGGSRLTEVVRATFGVTSSDSRLQRPEYIGGAVNPVVISEVLSSFQSPDGEGNPQGNMSGHGVSVGRSRAIRYRSEEHGYIIGIMSVLPRTAYQGGIHRSWLRENRLDFAWPQFANLGEQPIYDAELFYDPFSTVVKNTFGYTPRYAEYKYMPSTVHGQMRTNLDYWHMGRKFTENPNLNTAFVESDPTSRIFAVEDAEQLYIQMLNNIDVTRKLPYYGTPSF